VCREIAIAVAAKAMEQNVARKPVVPGKIRESLDSRMWVPKYARYVRSTCALV
jgi:malic enzyme